MITFTRTQAQIAIALLAVCKHSLKYQKVVSSDHNTVPAPINLAITNFLINYDLINGYEKKCLNQIIEKNYLRYPINNDIFQLFLGILPLFDGYISSDSNDLLIKAYKNKLNQSSNSLSLISNNEVMVDQEIQTLLNDAINKFLVIPFTNPFKTTELNKIAVTVQDILTSNEKDNDIEEFKKSFNDLMSVIDKKYIYSYNVMRYAISPYIVDIIYGIINTEVDSDNSNLYQKFVLSLNDELSSVHTNFIKLYNALSARPENDVIKHYDLFDDYILQIKALLPEITPNNDEQSFVTLEQAIIEASVSDNSSKTYYRSLMSIPHMQCVTPVRYVAASLYGVLSSLIFN